MTNEEFLISECDSLREEIKRLKHENKNTIKFSVSYNESVFEIDTQIPKPLQENQVYYYPDDNINPTPLKLIEYNVAQTVTENLLISAACLNLNTNEIEYYHPKNLFKTKEQAGNEYLKRKFGENYEI